MRNDEIDCFRLEILDKSKRLLELVNPTDEELTQLHNDLKQNPQDYTEGLENDSYWVALNILDMRTRAG